MNNLSSIMPMLMLGNGVSQKLKTTFMMDALVKDPKVKQIASIMQARQAGEESRSRIELKDEVEASVELLAGIGIEKLTAVLPEDQEIGKLKDNGAVARSVVQQTIKEFKSKPKAERSSVSFMDKVETKFLTRLKDVSDVKDLAGRIEASRQD